MASVLAPRRPHERESGFDVQQQRQIGLGPAANDPVESSDHFGPQLTAIPLIRHAGVVEAVAHHDFASGERRPHHFFEVLRPSRVHQRELGEGRQGVERRQSGAAERLFPTPDSRLPTPDYHAPDLLANSSPARFQERIAAAGRRAGRRPEDVKLVAVSKTVPPDRIRKAYDAGLRDFGENRVQEANAKRAALSDLTVTWHLVGHLQTNKAKLARELFHCVHSLDSLRLAQKLDQAAVCSGDRLPVLVEVNLGEEAAKSGVTEQEVLSLAEQVGRLSTLN